MAKWWGRKKEPLNCSSSQVDQCFIFSLTETNKKLSKKEKKQEIRKKSAAPAFFDTK